MKKFWDILGGVCAFLTVAVYAVLLIHSSWAFLPETIFNILVVVKTWAPLVVVVIAGLEFVSDKGFLFKVIFLVLVAAVVVSMFFPGTWNEFVGIINNKI